MGLGGISSTSHMKLQCSTAGGKCPWGSSSSVHMSLQLSTADGQQGVGWVLLHITHVTSNSQLLMGEGLSSSTLHVTSTLNCRWPTGGWVGPPPYHTCNFQLSTADGGGFVLLHIACHFNSELQMANMGGWVLLHIAHVTSTLNC